MKDDQSQEKPFTVGELMQRLQHFPADEPLFIEAGEYIAPVTGLRFFFDDPEIDPKYKQLTITMSSEHSS